MTRTVRLTAPTESAPPIVVSEPSSDAIHEAVTRLDGARHSELALDLLDSARPIDDPVAETLLIGGGANDRLNVAHVVRDDSDDWDQNFVMAVDTARSDELESGVVGGQETPLPAPLVGVS